MKNSVIVSAVRTAGGSFGGALASLEAPELGALVVSEAVKRAGIDPKMVDELIFGCGWQAGIGPNVARIASVNGGLPHQTTAMTINLRCGSSLRAAGLAASLIRSEDAEVLVVGGTESSSNVPYVLKDARWGHRMGDKAAMDILHKDGFMCSLAGMLMGQTAELLVEKYGI
jgi:acetyl-CoA C-acetyltransferase